MQKREKIGSARTGGQSAKKDEAAKLTFHKDQGTVLHVSEIAIPFNVAEEIQKEAKQSNRRRIFQNGSAINDDERLRRICRRGFGFALVGVRG